MKEASTFGKASLRPPPGGGRTLAAPAAAGRVSRGAAWLWMALVLAIPLTPQAAASASPFVDCTKGDNLQGAIDAAPPGSILAVNGTCSGNFSIAKSLTLKGAPEATFDGQGAGTTLTVTRGMVHLVRLTITGGNASGAAGIDNSAKLWLDRTNVTGNIATSGGSVRNTDTLSMTRSSVSSNGNAQTFDSGLHPDQGILNNGTLIIERSAVSLNQGGGIWNESGSVVIDHSAVSGNAVGGAVAAGLENEASATITDSTVSDNFTEYNGTPGIFNIGSMTIAFSTIARNYGLNNNSGGGGIENGGTLDVTSSTISDNSSDAITGSGIANGDPLDRVAPGTVEISATILAGNPGGDCFGQITSEGYNLVGTLFGYPACKFKARRTDIRGGTTSNIDPELKLLGGYGGPTETMPPRAVSPAVDVIPLGAMSADGMIALCPSSGTADQRGRTRPLGGACEMGSVEVRF